MPQFHQLKIMSREKSRKHCNLDWVLFTQLEFLFKAPVKGGKIRQTGETTEYRKFVGEKKG